jgi:cytochrome c peroxidase
MTHRTGLLIMLILIAPLGYRTASGWLPSARANDVAAEAVAVFDRQALARTASPPLGLPGVPGPDDNPLTAARIHLGRKLFFDRRLSHNNTMSCAMCHVPEQGFTVNEM